MDWDSVIGPKDKTEDQEKEVTSSPDLPDQKTKTKKFPEMFQDKRTPEKVFENLSKNIDKDGINLPAITSLADYSDEDTREPELIEGLLRMGHKCMISAGSKAGKSFLAIELALCIASGGDFIGHRCAKAAVLYVNLEISEPSFIYRAQEVCRKMGVYDNDEVKSNFKMLNLRGAATSLDKLANALVEAIKQEYKKSKQRIRAIILDPIYKISNGEENNARDVSRFCNQLDMISKETGCAIIYCHHHSKGDQGYKKAQDRASGSGVFARDADVIIDMVQLEIDAQTRNNIKNDFVCTRMIEKMESLGREWKSLVPEDQRKNSGQLSSAMLSNGMTWGELSDLNRKIDEEFEEFMQDFVAMRVEYTVREFRTPHPQEIVFKYPLHLCDDDGLLADAEPESHIQAEHKAKTPVIKENRTMTFQSLLDKALLDSETVSFADLKKLTGISDNRTLKDRLAELGDSYEIVPSLGGKSNMVRRKLTFET